MSLRFRSLGILAAGVSLLVGGGLHAEQWPGWRGPTHDGITTETKLPLHWDSEQNVAWKVPLPGVGHSSPIVWDDAIFVTTAMVERHERVLMRVARETGQIQWQQIVATSPIEQMHRDNTPASATPVTDGQSVFVAFCAGEELLVAAYDFSGELQWSSRPGTFESAHGFCTSLVLDQERLILSGLQDGPDAFVCALNKSTGEVLWKTPRPKAIRSFSSPLLCDHDGESMIVLSGADQTVAYESVSGRPLWTIEGPASKTVSSLVRCRETGLIFACGGRDNRFVAMTLAGKIVWESKQGIPYMTSPLTSRGRLHILSDEGVYRCYDAATGRTLNELRAVGAVRASMFANDDRIYVTEKSGRTTVIANDEQWRILAENDLGEEILASAAVSEGDLIFRTVSHLVLIRD